MRKLDATVRRRYLWGVETKNTTGLSVVWHDGGTHYAWAKAGERPDSLTSYFMTLENERFLPRVTTRAVALVFVVYPRLYVKSYTA